jgi:fibronectin-binding autotransporter adhesin
MRKILHDIGQKAGIYEFATPLSLTILLFSVAGGIRPALAACSAPVGGVVTCSGDDYPAGISDGAFAGGTLKVESSANIAPPAGTTGISISGTVNASVAVDLADGVTITTDGLTGNGLRAEASGTGDIVINSAANITITGEPNPPPPPPGTINGTSALLGWINSNSASGNIFINQLAGSIINADGVGGGGLYGLQQGSGDVTLTSAGTIVTAGESGYGINAVAEGGGDATTLLYATGHVITSGPSGVGIFTLNYGSGNASTNVMGTVTTTGEGAYGVLSQIAAAGSGNSYVDLSNTASIETSGDGSRGAWALNQGLGSADADVGSHRRYQGPASAWPLCKRSKSNERR